jgi:hypothetical protein
MAEIMVGDHDTWAPLQFERRDEGEFKKPDFENNTGSAVVELESDNKDKLPDTPARPTGFKVPPTFPISYSSGSC